MPFFALQSAISDCCWTTLILVNMSLSSQTNVICSRLSELRLVYQTGNTYVHTCIRAYVKSHFQIATLLIFRAIFCDILYSCCRILLILQWLYILLFLYCGFVASVFISLALRVRIHVTFVEVIRLRRVV